jgi:hypothetical protein
MLLPPDQFADRLDPLSAELEPAEVLHHPAFGQVSAWIDKALHSPPSAGSIGRMETLRHWDGLSAEKRQMLLLLAREMSQKEGE